MLGAGFPVQCGRCLPCLLNRRRLWTWRQYLESLCHAENCFVTLTYSDEHLPPRGELQPSHLRLFLKRFRTRIAPVRVRFFAVGEYGDGNGVRGREWNPHYHLSVFGVSGYTVVASHTKASTAAQVIAECWSAGFTYVAEFNERTAQYVTGYISKGFTRLDDPRLDGRRPEFSRMSLKPGIGAPAMYTIARSLSSSPGAVSVLRQGLDVPSVVRVGRRKIPIGRYLLGRLRSEYGMTDDDISLAKQIKGEASQVDLLALLQAALDGGETTISPKGVYLKSVAQRILSTEARHKIFKQRKSL